MLANHGDQLPVSAFPVDGTYPVGTSQWEKRNIAPEIPVWDEQLCIQCNKCALVCPHAAIRAKVYPADRLAAAPDDVQERGRTEDPDCSGSATRCRSRRKTAPAAGCAWRSARRRTRAMPAQSARHGAAVAAARSRARQLRFLPELPEVDRAQVGHDVKNAQLLEPLFEFSGACAGCGETPTSSSDAAVWRPRVIANATGCSSIYGGNLPTTPYTTNREAAAGLGELAVRRQRRVRARHAAGPRSARMRARAICCACSAGCCPTALTRLLTRDQSTEAGIQAQREDVAR